jgi:long-chain fatty acid transport protein
MQIKAERHIEQSASKVSFAEETMYHRLSIRHRFAVSALALMSGAVLTPQAQATNGYSPTGFGTTNKGLAGAGVAFPQDSLAAATNPAGTAHIGDRLDVGLALFIPDRGFKANDNADPPPQPSIDPGTYDSDNDWFLIPTFGWSHQLDEHSAVGVSIGGNGGMNTEYDTAVWQNFGAGSEPTGVDLAQVFLGVSYARRLNERHTLGIMPIVAVQRFKAEGLEAFDNPVFSTSPGKVTNNGYDYSWGYGLRVGWLGQLTDRLTIGVSAQTRLEMERFDKYAGLFAEQGDFDTPPTVAAGLAFKATPDITLVFDWQRIFYGEVDSISNPNDQFLQLGADDGLGFGWEDINIYKLGVQWQQSPQWTWRVGLSHADQLFDNGQALLNVLAPATVRTHASLGFSYRMSDRYELNLAYTHAFNEKIRGSNPSFTGSQTGFLEMDQDELEVSLSILF